MLQSRAVPGKSRFLEKTGCCRAEQFLDSLDSWKRRDAAEQSSSWIERYLEKTGCCRAERFLDRIDSWKRRDAAEQNGSWIE